MYFMASCGNLSDNLAGNSPKEKLLAEESWTAYDHDGVSYEMNSRCAGNEFHYYWDDQTFASYMVTVFPDISSDDALGWSIDILNKSRLDENFDSFQFDDWADLSVNAGAVYQYNTLSVFNKDGSGSYISVVMDNDVSVQVLAYFPSEEIRAYVKAELDHILMSLEISGAAQPQRDAAQNSPSESGVDGIPHVIAGTSWLPADDNSRMVFNEDGRFAWYQSKNDTEDNYFMGTYDFYVGQEALDYLTELSEYAYGVTEEDIQKYYLDSGLVIRDDFVCFSVDNQSFLLNGKEQLSEKTKTAYYGFFNVNGTFLNIYNMATGTLYMLSKEGPVSQ